MNRLSRQSNSLSTNGNHLDYDDWTIDDPSDPHEAVDYFVSAEHEKRLKNQVEYYFRPLNQNSYMIDKLKEGDGFVPVDMILGFRQVKQICYEANVTGSSARALFLKRALMYSDYVAFSKDGMWIGPTQIEDKTMDMLKKLLNQVQYYFSPENLRRDRYLQKVLDKGGGTVPLELLCDFPRIRKIHAEGCLGFSPKFPRKPLSYPLANPAVLCRALQGCKSLTFDDFEWLVGPPKMKEQAPRHRLKDNRPRKRRRKF